MEYLTKAATEPENYGHVPVLRSDLDAAGVGLMTGYSRRGRDRKLGFLSVL